MTHPSDWCWFEIQSNLNREKRDWKYLQDQYCTLQNKCRMAVTQPFPSLLSAPQWCQRPGILPKQARGPQIWSHKAFHFFCRFHTSQVATIKRWDLSLLFALTSGKWMMNCELRSTSLLSLGIGSLPIYRDKVGLSMKQLYVLTTLCQYPHPTPKETPNTLCLLCCAWWS